MHYLKALYSAVFLVSSWLYDPLLFLKHFSQSPQTQEGIFSLLQNIEDVVNFAYQDVLIEEDVNATAT